MQELYTTLNCNQDDPKQADQKPLSQDCIEKMHTIVRSYHGKFMKVAFTKLSGTAKKMLISN